jgi:hypothetical protein
MCSIMAVTQWLHATSATIAVLASVQQGRLCYDRMLSEAQSTSILASNII